ncbi:alpha-hydroxy-acid oxidizing protein [Orrella sp. NBD-18]|uniref:Alpha-hydroxy-acid oxidizing protein n=1 Tax=Sheuella amnicola TaxID=2707330 RepID=A0A6B2R0Y7_9BURK|nr:alpha-hydroxy acid oxidase [Sheuella amnicola]NDY83009.1 alpha-hydroxy-acid oxidizing protein [Sheuella amnicola]
MNTPRLSRHLSKILSLADFEREAQKRLPRPIYGYVSGACEDCNTLRENRNVFAEYEFVPRVLVDVSKRQQQIELFGDRYASPFGIAPMGITALSAYRGDVVLAQAGQRANIPVIMSGSSLIRMEEVAQAAPNTWFQAYLPGRVEEIMPLIDRVIAAKFKTLVITVDTAAAANRENNVRTGFSTPLRPSARLAWDGISHPRWLFGTFLKTLMCHGMPHFENSFATRGAPIMSKNVLRDFSSRGHLSWQHIREIRAKWKGPMVIKGILHPEDAKLARQYGMDGLIVSNHGGRQLDGAITPLRALPRILEHFKEGPVMLDSGVRRGSDVLKALALGARCVFLGRPFNYAAAVGGAEGVDHAISLLEQEVSRNMAMMGVNSVSELSPECLVHVAR